jgi:hypothetical protein
MYNPSKTLQGMTNNVVLTFSVGDTKYHIFCTFSMCMARLNTSLGYWISYIDSGLKYDNIWKEQKKYVIIPTISSFNSMAAAKFWCHYPSFLKVKIRGNHGRRSE